MERIVKSFSGYSVDLELGIGERFAVCSVVAETEEDLFFFVHLLGDLRYNRKKLEKLWKEYINEKKA